MRLAAVVAHIVTVVDGTCPCVEQIERGAGSHAPAGSLGFDRVVQKPGPGHHHVGPGRVPDLADGGVGPRVAHRFLQHRCGAPEVAERRQRRLDRVVERRISGERPLERNDCRRVEPSHHARLVVGVGRGGHSRVTHVEGLIERPAVRLTYIQHGLPVATDLDVGDLWRAVHEVGKVVDRLSIHQRAELGQ